MMGPLRPGTSDTLAFLKSFDIRSGFQNKARAGISQRVRGLQTFTHLAPGREQSLLPDFLQNQIYLIRTFQRFTEERFFSGLDFGAFGTEADYGEGILDEHILRSRAGDGNFLNENAAGLQVLQDLFHALLTDNDRGRKMLRKVGR